MIGSFGPSSCFWIGWYFILTFSLLNRCGCQPIGSALEAGFVGMRVRKRKKKTYQHGRLMLILIWIDTSSISEEENKMALFIFCISGWHFLVFIFSYNVLWEKEEKSVTGIFLIPQEISVLSCPFPETSLNFSALRNVLLFIINQNHVYWRWCLSQFGFCWV